MTDTDSHKKAGDSVPRFLISSLGCKVNQAEAAWLGRRLEQSGWQPSGENAPGLVVLFTCSVTASAARQSRQTARRLAGANPGARVVITGCDVQAEPEVYRGEGMSLLGRSQLSEFPSLAAQTDIEYPDGVGPPDSGPLCPGVEFPGPRRTRGLLKVQDGCDAYCAYCIVPHTRGAPRSTPPQQAQEAWRELGRAGAAEVVLTGIHLGRYGQDLAEGPDLAGLVRLLLDAHPGPRMRLSSLEMSEIGPGLIDLLAHEPRLCPHLHIPLQSGSDRILEAMGRSYKACEYEAKIMELASVLPGLCLGADVLVGLPGEDQAAFDETYDLLKRLPLSYLHVFPYSPRPGVPAADMPGRPQGPVVKQRAARLRELGREKFSRFLAGQVGRTLTVVVESSGLARAGNYSLVELPGDHQPGELLKVQVLELAGNDKGPCLKARAYVL